MNWIVFAIAAYLFIALEVGLRPLFLASEVEPSFVLILAVYIGLMAPSQALVWAFLILGALLDLAAGPISGVYILGPSALGYLVGSCAIIQFRGLVFRESLFSLAVMTIVAGIFIHLTIVFIYTFRGFGVITGEPVAQWSATGQLFNRLLELFYTAALAFPVGWLLYKTTPIWDFPGKKNKRKS